MEGTLKVFFKIINGAGVTVELSEILKNEKVVNVIKNNFAKGIRGAVIHQSCDCKITIEKESPVYEIEIPKKDFQDAMSFVEEYVDEHKLNKKNHQIEIVDIKV